MRADAICNEPGCTTAAHTTLADTTLAIDGVRWCDDHMPVSGLALVDLLTRTDRQNYRKAHA